MTDPAVREAPVAAPSRWHRARRGMLVSLAVGVFLGLVGPFGTIEAPFLSRMVYWVVLILAGSVLAELVTPALTQRIPREWPTVAVWLLFSVVIAVPMCVLVPTVSHLMFGWRFGGGWQNIGILVFYVWVISAFMAALGTWLGIKERDEADTAVRLARLEAVARLQASGGEPARALRERLPMRLRRAAIHALQAEDHYVRVHTAAGSELLLMRLADAIREAEGLAGLQTHRSWWVAEAGVAGVEREGERLVIRLHGGAAAPVSRSWQKAVRDAGWR